MEPEETIHILPDRPPRHCPVCGARVAEGARTCLMCGTPLEAESPAATEETSSKLPQRRWYQVVILIAVAFAVLAVAAVVGWNLSQREPAASELPTFTPTATLPPTRTPTPTMTPIPTQTPTPQSTPTPAPPLVYFVQQGDSLSTIAEVYDLAPDELSAFNQLESDFLSVGQQLLIPVATPTPGPTPTLDPDVPTPTLAPYVLHTVRVGDTLSTLAEQYNVSIADIVAASNLPASTDQLQVNQVLTIPQFTPTPTPAPPIASNDTVTETAVLASYSAPPMLYPADKARFIGTETPLILHWASVGILSSREFYHVEFIVATAEGQTTVNTYQHATAWRVPEELLPAADVTDRQCFWRVNIVRRVTESGTPTYKQISPPVKRRTFTWVLPAGE